jgi:hypothetical protein
VKAGKKQWCFTISQSTESDKPNNANPKFSLTSLTIDFWQLFCTPSFGFLDFFLHFFPQINFSKQNNILHLMPAFFDYFYVLIMPLNEN